MVELTQILYTFRNNLIFKNQNLVNVFWNFFLKKSSFFLKELSALSEDLRLHCHSGKDIRNSFQRSFTLPFSFNNEVLTIFAFELSHSLTCFLSFGLTTSMKRNLVAEKCYQIGRAVRGALISSSVSFLWAQLSPLWKI